MRVELIEYPTPYDWARCKARALVTIGKPYNTEIDVLETWKRRILEARHSPIRCLMFSFYLEDIPSNTATHFARHVHAQPYVSSLRNDRQSRFDGDKAPRDTPVNMLLDVNAEELMVMANKRLCSTAAKRTRDVMKAMCDEVIKYCPEFKDHLVPMCKYNGGVCHEFVSCGLCPHT